MIQTTRRSVIMDAGPAINRNGHAYDIEKRPDIRVWSTRTRL